MTAGMRGKMQRKGDQAVRGAITQREKRAPPDFRD
jgi:hypothetical protein